MWISQILDDKCQQELLVQVHPGSDLVVSDDDELLVIPYSLSELGEAQLLFTFMLKEEPCHSVAYPLASQLLGPASTH